MNVDNKNNFNRALNIKLDYYKANLMLSVLFNKHNTYTAYHIDPLMYHKLKQKNYINIFFDCKKSQFCDTFFDMSDYSDDGCNMVNNFNGIYTQYKDIMFYEDKETIILDKILHGTTFIENKIDINIIRLYKFKKDFLCCFVNRQFVNDKKKKIIRSSCFTIYTKECNNYLQQLYKKYKSNGIKYQTTENAIESLFENDSTLTPQQIQNGFQL